MEKKGYEADLEAASKVTLSATTALKKLAKAQTGGYGARVGGSKINAVNLILRLFLYHILHTMSS